MRVGTYILGLILILAGLLLFLNNLGYTYWGIGKLLSQFWPVLLIIIGISFFWGGRIPAWMAFLSIVLLAGAVIMLAVQTPARIPHLTGEETILRVERSQHHDLAAGTLALQFGGGRLVMDSFAEEWLEGEFRGPWRAAPSIEKEGDTIEVTVKQQEGSWRLRNGAAHEWALHLSGDLLWEVKVDIGAVQAEMDLSGIPLSGLDMKVGAGDLNLKLGDNGVNTPVSVKAGASNIEILVVEGTAVKIHLRGALTSTNLDDMGWLLVDGEYYSPGYEEASSRLDLDVDMGAGNLQVDYFQRTI